jgi:hypothetical protein
MPAVRTRDRRGAILDGDGPLGLGSMGRPVGGRRFGDDEGLAGTTKPSTAPVRLSALMSRPPCR